MEIKEVMKEKIKKNEKNYLVSKAYGNLVNIVNYKVCGISLTTSFTILLKALIFRIYAYIFINIYHNINNIT